MFDRLALNFFVFQPGVGHNDGEFFFLFFFCKTFCAKLIFLREIGAQLHEHTERNREFQEPGKYIFDDNILCVFDREANVCSLFRLCK